MNITTASIHPGIKALVAGCSLALMSAFVWYSHSQAQSKSTAPEETTAKSPAPLSATQTGDAASMAVTPSNPSQSTTRTQREVLMPGSKSYGGTMIIKAETPNLPKDFVPNGDTKLFRSQESEPKTIHTAEDASKLSIPKDVLMPGSKIGIIFTTIKDPDYNSNNKQIQSQSKSTDAQPNQAPGVSPQPVVPKDVLMLSSKALTQPVFSTKRINPDSQKTAPTAGQEKSQQK